MSYIRGVIQNEHMMRTILLLLCLAPLGVRAQEMARYLEGAVPVKEGRVVFTRVVEAPGLPAGEIFARAGTLAGERFKNEDGKEGAVVYVNEDEGVVICRGREYIEFKRSALVLDRALIEYQATYACREGACELEVTRVRYFYGEEKKTRYLAEEWITDEYAYNKKRNTLSRGSDKFRIKTIDLVDELEKGLSQALLHDQRPLTRVLPVEETPAVVAGREGYQRILPAELNGNFIHMLESGRLTVPDAKVSTRYGGIGVLLDRPVVYCFAEEMTGIKASFSLEWKPEGEGRSLYREVIFECRLLAVQQLFNAEPDERTATERVNSMFIGEIVAVWVK
jgi:hypothetical protein